MPILQVKNTNSVTEENNTYSPYFSNTAPYFIHILVYTYIHVYFIHEYIHTLYTCLTFKTVQCSKIHQFQCDYVKNHDNKGDDSNICLKKDLIIIIILFVVDLHFFRKLNFARCLALDSCSLRKRSVQVIFALFSEHYQLHDQTAKIKGM